MASEIYKNTWQKTLNSKNYCQKKSGCGILKIQFSISVGKAGNTPNIQ